MKHRSFRPLCCLPFVSLLLQAGIFSIESEHFILLACSRVHCRCMLPHSLTCKNLEKGCLGDSLEGGEKSASLPVIKPRVSLCLMCRLELHLFSSITQFCATTPTICIAFTLMPVASLGLRLDLKEKTRSRLLLGKR